MQRRQLTAKSRQSIAFPTSNSCQFRRAPSVALQMPRTMIIVSFHLRVIESVADGLCANKSAWSNELGRVSHHSPPPALVYRERLTDLGDCLLRRRRVDHDDVGQVADGKTIIS